MTIIDQGAAADEAHASRARRLVAGALWKALGAADRVRALAVGRDATIGYHQLSEFEGDSPSKAAGVFYSPTPWAVLARLQNLAVPKAERGRYTFVDYGAGKGRVLISAARLGYGKGLCIEFIGDLARDGQSNLAAAGVPPERFSIVEADATTCPLPPGPLVVYLFNPFGPPVLDTVIARIAAAAAERTDPIVVIYFNAVHASRFEANPAFVRRTGAVGPLLRALLPCPLAIYDCRVRAA